MSKVNIDLLINTANSAKSLKETKQAIKDLKDAALQAGSGEEFNRLTQAAGKLQDKVGDVNSRIKVLASDTQKLQGAIGTVQGLAGAFGAVQSATALFGANSEKLQQTMVKLQATMTLLNSLQSVANVLNKDNAASIFIKTAAQKAYNLVVGASTGALKAFRIALAATGIGLFVIAIAALIENWDKLTGAIGNNTTAIKDATAAQEEYKNKLNETKNLIDLVRIAEELNEKQKKSLNSAIGQQKERLEDLKTSLIAVQKGLENAAKRAQEAGGKYEATKEKTRLLTLQQELLEKATGKTNITSEEAIKILDKNINLLKEAEEKTKTLSDTQTKSTSPIDALRKKVADLNKEMQNQAVLGSVSEKTTRSYTLAVKELEEAMLEVEMAMEKASPKMIKPIEKAQIETEKLNTEIKKIPETFENTKEKIDVLSLALDVFAIATKASFDIINNQMNATFDKQMANIDKTKNSQLAALDAEREARNVNFEKMTAEEQAKFEREQEYKQQKEAIERLAAEKTKKLKQEQFKKQKKASLIESVINTALSIASANRLVPPANIPAMILAGIAGAAQTAVIASQPIPEFKKGGLIVGKSHKEGGVVLEAEGGESIINAKSTAMYAPLLSKINQVGGGVPIVSKFEKGGVVGNNIDMEKFERIMTNQNTPIIKTYVVESEMTSSQRRINNIEKRSKF
jgi:hypothetical protein